MSAASFRAFAAAVAFAAACGHGTPEAPPPPAVAVSTGQLVIPEGGVAFFEARLVARPAAPVEVEVRSGAPTLGLVLPPGYAVPAAVRQLTFNPEDWDVPRRIAVFAARDLTARPNPPYDVTLRVTAASAPALLAASAAAVRVTTPDDDVPGFTVSRDAVVTSEVGTRASFEVRLTARPTGSVRVPVRGLVATEGETSPPTSYFDPITLTTWYRDVSPVFDPDDWDVPKTFTVVGLDDGIADGDRTYPLTVGPPELNPFQASAADVAAWAAVPARQVVVTNREAATDEGAAVAPVELARVGERWSQVGTGESRYVVRGAAGTVVVALAQPTGDVALAVDGDGDFSGGVLCTSDAAGMTEERCEVAVPPQGTLHVRVTAATARGAAYLLRVEDWLPGADAPKAIVPSGYPPVPTVSSLLVTSGPWTVGKVRVRLHLSIVDQAHYARVALVSPAGTRIELSNNYTEGSFAGTVFDDAAPLHIYKGTPPYTGAFRPVGSGYVFDPFVDAPLSAATGETARGLWTLEVVHFDPGATLDGWSLEIR